jgi:4-carboxymuconolactone decarboxylase
MTDSSRSDPGERTRRGRARVLPSSPSGSHPPGSALEILERIAFGEVWQRPGLTPRDRRLITLTCLAIGGTDRTLGLHLRGALDSGDLTAAELDEFAVQLGIYAGFPRASAFTTTLARVIEETGDAPSAASE